MIGNLQICLFCVVVGGCVGKCMLVRRSVNPKCGLRVECVGNRHDNIDPSFYSVKV